ncbi:MAG TPA: glycine zipper 2TM domain-containing protein [Burkholderiaceae bacterium]
MNDRRPSPSLRCLLAAALALVGAPALATEYGKVVSSTPVMGDVAVPQRQCFDELQSVPARGYGTTGAGALLGAVVGGVVGNSVGAGMGRAAATGLGVIAGAAVGDNVEAAGNPPAVTTTTVRRCQTVTQREQRVIGYDVVYDYAGRRYSARMAQDPGERVPLDVRVTPAHALPPARTVPPAYRDDGRGSVVPYVGDDTPVYVEPAPRSIAAPPVVWGPPAVYVAPSIWFGGSWGPHRHWH